MSPRRCAPLCLALLLSACNSNDVLSPSPARTFVLEEATVADIHAAFAGEQRLEDGSLLTCSRLYQLYTTRIAAYDATPQSGGLPILSVLRINPQAEPPAEAVTIDPDDARRLIADTPLTGVD